MSLRTKAFVHISNKTESFSPQKPAHVTNDDQEGGVLDNLSGRQEMKMGCPYL